MFLPGTWIYRDFSTRQAIDLSQGFIADWPASRTGWTSGGGAPGVAPIQKWNASRKHFEPRPGPEWKKAFSVPIAYAPDSRAMWDQGGAGVFNAFIALMRALMEGGAPEQLPLLPLVRATGTRTEKFPNGASVVPVFELLRYVGRPVCLPIEEAAPLPVMPTPTPLAPPQQAPQRPSVQAQSVDWSLGQRPPVQPVITPLQPSGWDAPGAAGRAPTPPPQAASVWEAPAAHQDAAADGLIDDGPSF
jgi:hypothetical protein